MALPPKVFDRELIARRLRRRPSGRDDFVMRLVLDDLAERLLTLTRSFERALILSPDPAPLPAEGVTANGRFAFERLGTVLGDLDAEALTLPRSDYDLIVSLLDLTIVDDVPGFLARVRAHLAPDGLFLAAALGGDTLTELRQAFLAADMEVNGGAYARVAPFVPVGEVAGLLQRARFALPVGDVETHVVRYGSPLKLIEELKALGASNPLADRPGRLATKRLIATAAAAYEAAASDADGRVRATLEIVWMSGWAPHESQQKPLKPGSAEISLTKVLGKPGRA
jgi:SAM-dependent methyltransferase